MEKLLNPICKLIVVASALLMSLMGCQFRTPAALSPVVNNSGELIPKSFFFSKGISKLDGDSEQKFAAGWAPIDEKGKWAEYFMSHGVPQITHLNIRWRITEKAVLGYEINPSFAAGQNNAHAPAIFEIPISRHYYYEPEKDGYQRDTNRMVKNESRDAWMYRPYMDLDFKGMKINSDAFQVMNSDPRVIDVSEFVWDQKNQYLAFTAEVKDSGGIFSWFGTGDDAQQQGRIRFNFMAFEGAPGFKPTPYDISTSQRINVLHVLGRTIDGQQEVNYAGHWDLSKPITFYTYGVKPGSEYMQIIQDCVEEWNQGFVKAGLKAPGEKAIVLNTMPLAYPFDLRYPVINWISDKRRAFKAPLGIGEAAADVTTGQILWGSLSIWSGIVEDYVNRYSSSEAAYSAMGMSEPTMSAPTLAENLNIGSVFDPKALSTPMHSPFGSGASMTDYLRGKEGIDQMKMALEAQGSKSIREFKDTNLELSKKMAESYASFQANEGMFAEEYLKHLETDLVVKTQFQTNIDRLAIFHSMFSSSLFDAPQLEEAKVSLMTPDQAQKISQGLVAKFLKAKANAQISDFDRTFADVVPGWVAARQQMPNADEHQIVRSLLKNLVIHEMGHVLGLGHNFMGNILPQQGTVAESVREELKTQLKEKGYVATTVMDYYSPRTEVAMEYNDVKAGLYDVQMLRFLYAGEFPVIDKGGKTERFVKVKEDGIIPTEVNFAAAGTAGQSESYHLAFLPSCNDIDASFNLNPLCQRFDRGATAKEIMVSRFKDFNSGLMSMLNAFSGAKEGSIWRRENYLWWRTLSEFSEIRIFYDRMRSMIDDDSRYQDAFATIRHSQDALLAFSQACIDPNTAPGPEMQQAFAKLALKDPSKLGTPISQLQIEDFTELHDYCEANKIAMDQFAQILMRKGSDTNVIDRERRFEFGGMTGGETNLQLDWSRVWGSYKEIGSFPIRFLTLFTVSTPIPVFYGFYPIPLYDNPQGRYSYASLYPSEFSTVVDTAVRENLMYGGGALEEPTVMGSTLLYMDFFLWRNFIFTKDDTNRFPAVFVDNLKSMTTFDISLSPIILTNVTNPKKRDTLAFKYNAAYYDLGERDTIPIPYAYLLPDRRVIAKGTNKQILMPITKLRYLTDKWGYVWALNLRYDDKRQNPFKGTNVKYGLDQGGYQKELANCVDGPAGVAAFFNDNNPDFEGFEVGKDLATKQDIDDKFEDSLNTAWKTYREKGVRGIKPNPNACEDSVLGIGLSVCGAAIINGFTLPDCYKYLNL